jgi:hypothetical protein
MQTTRGMVYLPMRSQHMWAYGRSRVPPVWSKKIPGQQDLGLGQYEVPPELWPGLERITPTGARSAVGCTSCGFGAFEMPAFLQNPTTQLLAAAGLTFLALRFLL